MIISLNLKIFIYFYEDIPKWVYPHKISYNKFPLPQSTHVILIFLVNESNRL